MSVQITRDKGMEIPLIQGGMGVGISLGSLAGHVAKEGGMGVISTAIIGYREDDYWKNSREKNKIALKKEIKKAKEISSGKGLIAINLMVCTTNYEEMAAVAVEAGIDAIISGAGLPLLLPKYTNNTPVAAAPIVSSGRAASVICKRWDREFSCAPDFIVVEGAKAGGHLGFSEDELVHNTAKPLEVLLLEVMQAVKPYEVQYQREIPIFVAGGVKNHEEMLSYLALGASGIQIATPFIAAEECDAALAYKNQYVAATEKDLQIIKSPVGLPARALKTPFIEKLYSQENIAVSGCIRCIHSCNSTSTPYCISRALIQAALGNVEEGLFFSGAEVQDICEITTVKNVIETFMNGR